MKETWNILKKVLPDKKCNPCSHLVINGEIVSDPVTIATEFNKMFSQVFESVHDVRDPGEVNENGENAIKRLRRAQSHFVFEEISPEFVVKELRNLDCSKSVGLDDLHPIGY